MAEKNITPAQAAKEFAALNGFVIAPEGRRYRITRVTAPNATIAEVGGYPAALNAMRTQATADAHCDVVRDDGALLDELGKIPPKTRAQRNKAVYGDERGMAGIDYPLPPLKVEPVFADFNGESQARIRNAANRITKQRRKASGKPSGGPWHVIFNGLTVMMYGYPSRADALAVVRWGFNHVDPVIRNNWRTATVTMERRAS